MVDPRPGTRPDGGAVDARAVRIHEDAGSLPVESRASRLFLAGIVGAEWSAGGIDRAGEGSVAIQPAPSSTPASTTTVYERGPNLLVRFIWWLLIGWWASGIAVTIAWIALITIIGIPLGIWIINRLPTSARGDRSSAVPDLVLVSRRRR